MKPVDKQLAKEVECSNCRALVELEPIERIERRFICPECQTQTDLGITDEQLNSLQPGYLKEQISAKSDEDLFLILAQLDDYELHYLTLVVRELRKRGIEPKRQRHLEASASEVANKRFAIAEEPLGVLPSILMFFLGPAFVPIMIAEFYRNRGYKRKAADCWRMFGFAMLVCGIIFLVNLLRH